MTTYKVVLEEKALESLKQIPNPHKNNIFKKLKYLETPNYQTTNVKKLKGYENGYRLRVGNYRVLFLKKTEKKVIEIYQIGHRKDIYR
jgi:mRNA interferase RelE/StbE